MEGDPLIPRIRMQLGETPRQTRVWLNGEEITQRVRSALIRCDARVRRNYVELEVLPEGKWADGSAFTITGVLVTAEEPPKGE